MLIILNFQDDKDKNVRSRYNGRLLLSWLQDVDDKWKKIKVQFHTYLLGICHIVSWNHYLEFLLFCIMKACLVTDFLPIFMVIQLTLKKVTI